MTIHSVLVTREKLSSSDDILIVKPNLSKYVVDLVWVFFFFHLKIICSILELSCKGSIGMDWQLFQSL